MKNPSISLFRNKPRGFTLIELIAVIMVIAILMGIGATTLKNVTTAKGVNTGVPIAESIFSEARSLAKGRGVDAYVIIYADTSDNDADMTEKLYRYMGVATNAEYDANGNLTEGSGTLRLTSRGSMLPTKTFLNANLSGLTDADKMPVLIPGSSDPKECYVYRFNSEGILVEPTLSGANGPQALFVIQSGVMTPGSDFPKELPKNEKDVGGFAVWRSGQTSVFRHPDQILDINGAVDASFE
ncbi:hypothetical protein Rhal01_01008 [Rubritalea halochordaticola]|uniref:Prepilin-type N-terminal cleavage/methylation domain-containing protein n=1 Tax=Rubritalea halochordaticola TaxID=714537 RepID=A0ABP9UYS1_9BACT